MCFIIWLLSRVDIGVDLVVYIVVEIDLSVRIEIIWVAKNENYTSTNILRIIMQ